MTGETGLRVPRGRLRTLDSTLSGSAVSVQVRGRFKARQSKEVELTLARGQMRRDGNRASQKPLAFDCTA